MVPFIINITMEINFSSKVYSTGCMTSLVIHYNVYILKDPKNFNYAVGDKGLIDEYYGDFPMTQLKWMVYRLDSPLSHQVFVNI